VYVTCVCRGLAVLSTVCRTLYLFSFTSSSSSSIIQSLFIICILYVTNSLSSLLSVANSLLFYLSQPLSAYTLSNSYLFRLSQLPYIAVCSLLSLFVSQRDKLSLCCMSVLRVVAQGVELGIDYTRTY
jgi:ABC-type proline/glycine betaine transport system permease subunit